MVALAGCGTAPVETAQANDVAASAPAATASAAPSAPASPSSAAAEQDIAALSDEFDSADSLADWKEVATVEGWPSRIEQLDVNTTQPGALHLVPLDSGWFEDYHGIFLYKEVTGDFDVRTRVLATGKASDLPTLTYSLTGLMARAPRDVTADTWQPGAENWVFITAGYGDNHPSRAGKPQIETKTTKNSRSTLVLRAVPAGWIELRVVRVGANMLMLYRSDDGPWKLSKQYQRPDLPETLQVGLNAYSSGERESGSDPGAYNRRRPELPGDLVVRSEYVRFRRPDVSPEIKARAAQETLVADEWLAAIGD